MDEMKQKTRYAVPLRGIIIGMVVIGFLISSVLLFFMIQTSRSYSEMRNSTQGYIDCQGIANSLLSGSDALTIYARGFVVTSDSKQAELYYNDTQAQNAIDEALAEIRSYSVDERVLSQLNSAMQLRDRMMTIEHYAMRLKAEAMGGDISEYPALLQAVQLLPSDLLLSSEQKEEKARSFLFDIDYESTRNEISLRINRGMDILMSSMLTRQMDSSDHLLRVLHRQQVLTVMLMLFILALAVGLFVLVISPLQKQIRGMIDGRIVTEEGTREIRFLARTYNSLYEQNRLATEKLSYEATHDELTGLYNRAAYESMLGELTKEGEKIALILMDVDLFKHINDKYGHDVGDAVLKFIAKVLGGIFRKDDAIYRLGGDEFVVLMSNVDSGSKSLISDRLKALARKLATPEKGLPQVSLSAGIAFKVELMPGTDMFKSADLALYHVKNNGRNGCGFASASGEIEMMKYDGPETGE